MKKPSDDDLVILFHKFIVALIRREGEDLSIRQLAIFLTCYMEDEVQTVVGLAAMLQVSKRDVSRALSHLVDFDCVRPKIDTSDQRNILVQRTAAGLELLREYQAIIVHARQQATTEPGMKVSPLDGRRRRPTDGPRRSP